jgi:uncharacterized protein YjbI with pentapeptide repeats
MKQITSEQIAQALEDHGAWIKHHGERGRRADFANTSLVGHSFTGLSLSDVNFEGADLTSVSFESTTLRDCTFRNAILSNSSFHAATLGNCNLFGVQSSKSNMMECSFSGCLMTTADFAGADFRAATLGDSFLENAILRNANLRNADLLNVRGLTTEQLAGADLSGAKVPGDIVKFSGVAAVQGITKYSRKIMAWIILGCLYCWLLIGGTSDVQLLTNNAAWNLPILGSQIRIRAFFLLAPAVLLCLHMYFHIYLQRMWDNLAKLPARFPDGSTLDQRADPWALTGVLRAYFSDLQRDRPPFSKLQNAIVILLAWWLVPLTLGWFWIRFVTPLELWVTLLHLGFVVAGLGVSLLFFSSAIRTLLGIGFEKSAQSHPVRLQTRIIQLGFYPLSAILIFLTLEHFDSRLSFHSPPSRSSLYEICRLVGYNPYVDVQDCDVSTRLEGLNPQPVDQTTAKGPELRGRRLWFLNGYRSFLESADLRGADLRFADFRGADLRGSNLDSANLNGADLRGARLQFTKLVDASFRDAKLDGAWFEQSDLSNADFRGASMRGALSLHLTRISDADFRGVDFTGEEFLSREQYGQARVDSTTILPRRLLTPE